MASGAAQNNGGSLNTMDFRFAVDGTPIRSYSTYSNTVPNSYASDVHLTEFFTATAAQHTITLLGGRNNATSMILWDQFTVSAYQVRGGLVPITDGFTTVDKPTSQKFVNASVTDDAGQAVVTLPEAVVAPGSTQTIFDQIPGGTYQITNTSAFEDFDASFEQEFTVQTAGTYLLTWAATIFGASSSGGGYLRLLFDEGGFNGHTEQTVGDATKPWGIQASSLFHEARSFSASVTLAAGTHKVKPQCQKETVYGTANPSIDGNSSWFIQATLVSGSGAQGNLLAEAATTVNNTVTALSPSVLPTEPLLVSFDSADENVTLHFNGLIANTVGSGATTVIIEPWMDGSAVGAHQLIIPTAGWYESSSFSIPVAVTAGSHTVEIYAYTGTSQQWRLQAGAKFWVMQDRGGLVPIKNDGVLIQDTPHSINLLGPGLQGTNVNGAVHVSVNSAAEGVDTESYTIPWPTTVNTASPSYQNIHEFTFDVTEGERLLCTFSGRGNPAASGVGMYVRFYSVELGTNWGFTNVYAETDNLRNVGTSGMSPPLPAGTATIRLEASTAGVGGNWDMEGGYFTVSRFRGGFVVPENVPELAYNSASVIDVQPKAGTSSRLWLLLNDGVRYHADGTQTIDLTTSGLGGLDTGSEAVSTWYYCYAVPSDTAGVFDVVASETDPDSGGPTGYAAWRYLGAVYNDSAGDLRKWYQTGATFEYATHYDAYDSGGTGTTDASPVLTDLTDYVPKTSASAILQLYRQGQNVAGSFQVWVDGEQGDVSTGWHISVANPDTAYSGQANMGLVPTPGTTKQIYRRNTANYNYSYIKCMGWVDRWLDSNNSQAQTSYDPDTPPPRGTWIDTTEVDFAAWPGHPSTLRLALSDGKTRIASGTLAVDKNNGVADLGYDDASSQGNSKWLYFYAVPKTGDDDAFTIVMSDNPPTTGPLGRSASKYLWSTYIDGSGDLREVFQVDVERFITNDTKPAASCTTLATWIGSWTDYAIDDVVPLTASAVEIRAHIRHTASGTSQQALLVGPEGGGWLYPAYCLGANDFNQVCGLVPLPGTATKKVALQNYTWDATTDQVAHQEIRFSGWVDGYLAADAGIGAVVGGGGTASPLTTKGDLYTYDTDNARLGVGSNGQVLTADSAEATGIKWASISHPTQAYLREEAFSTTGAETPGATVSHVIAATPRAAGTTSGYDVVVFRNGLKMKNVASLTGAYDEFTFTVGTLTVAVTASGSADDYDVDFRS